jgi:hypothetical protein
MLNVKVQYLGPKRNCTPLGYRGLNLATSYKQRFTEDANVVSRKTKGLDMLCGLCLAKSHLEKRMNPNNCVLRMI